MSSTKIIFAILATIFSTYTIYMFMQVFFAKAQTSKKIEFCSYAFYCLLNCLLYITFQQPKLLLVFNLLSFFLLTFNYPSTPMKRLTAVVFIYIISLSIEVFTLFSLQLLGLNFHQNYTDGEYAVAQICICILTYMIIRLLTNVKLQRNQINIPRPLWIATIAVPLATLLPIAFLSYIPDQSIFIITISVASLFAINIFIFYLYDHLLAISQQNLNHELLKQQNAAYAKQLELIQENQNNLRILKHDLKNHFIILGNHIQQQNLQAALDYIDEISQFITNHHQHISTGNEALNAILNHKLDLAAQHHIPVKLNLQLPNELHISIFDLTALLGNLLDNAIEAVSPIDDTRIRKIDLSISYDRSLVYITISNPYRHQLRIHHNRLLTTHRDQAQHGYGLQSVACMVEKYDGIMEISHQNQQFTVDILLYNTPQNQQNL